VARLVTLNVLDPVSTEILAREIAATSKAATNSDEQYFAAESELTHALCHIFDDESDASELMASMPEVGDVVGELAQACRRVALARRFHNDAVGSAQLLHKRKIVRYLRLAGRTPWPVTVDMYDQIPVGLGHVE
jgi:hypothetical protein